MGPTAWQGVRGGHDELPDTDGGFAAEIMAMFKSRGSGQPPAAGAHLADAGASPPLGTYTPSLRSRAPHAAGVSSWDQSVDEFHLKPTLRVPSHALHSTQSQLPSPDGSAPGRRMQATTSFNRSVPSCRTPPGAHHSVP